MSNKRRNITLSQNALDPLSRWYFSQIKFGDVYGNKVTNPVVNDRRLFIDPERDIGGLGGGEASDPHVTWNLAGTNINGEPNETTIPMLDEFVDALLAYNTNIASGLYVQGNQYIFTEKAVGTNPETYRSMPRDMMSDLLSTSEQLLVQILSPQTDINAAISNFSVRLENGNLVESREFSSFISNEPVDNARLTYIRSVVDIVKQDLRDEVRNGQRTRASIIDIITQTLILVAQNPEPVDIERAGKFLIYVMVNEVLKLPINQDLIKTSLLAIDLSPSRHFYTEIDTPYISNKKSSQFLEELSTGEPYRAAIETNYSYYVEGYEKASQNSNIPETILPNIYTRNYYKQLANRRDDLGQQRKYDEFRSILGLGMDLKQEALDSVYDTFYYSSFGSEVIDTDDQTVLIIDNKNKSIIFNGDQISQGALVGGSAPLSLEVEFTRGSFGSYQELVDDEDGVPDVSQAIFENIERTPQNQFRSTTLYSTEYLEDVNGQLEEKESPYAFSELRHFPLSRIFTSYDSYQDYQSLIITNTTNLTPPEDNLIIANEVISAQANINSRQSYGAIISGEDSRSESLGYKISKRDVGGQLLQNFYIANGRGDKVITYRDAQVKYGAEYQYDLYEYRLIYGTQYKFKTTSVDLPLWMMENYLGLSTDAEERVREISNSRLQGPGIEPGEALPIPNITFNSYVEEFADPRVVEVPIYDDSFNRQQIFSILPVRSRDALERTEFGSAGAISYPRAKVLDRPPTAPVLNVFPLFGIQDQVKMSINLQTGNNTGTRNSREIVSIGDMTDKIRALKEYQDNYLNTFLPPNKMEYKNEGLSELRNIVLYRTAQINLDVENYNDIYQSFDPETNSGVLVRRYTDRNLGEEGDGIAQIPSYDILDNIQPNVNYYYTCIVEDVHGNPSNPSVIYRVRLLLDKGLLIPEIDTVLPTGANQIKPQKNLARYVQIDASNIQSFPYIQEGAEAVTNERSLGSALGKSIEDQSYIVRFTSKDTGRRFDLKLNFVVRINGVPINVGT